ncbi:ATP-binding protein [Streptomyces sp. TP-A0874]|uniref:ATP-binding protein n=1 Tax=Streptomyces sp. TP-A0874 TaxID=549819 RepID=UPI000853326E|nr:ATP-binding protein [Streptomyces sp. TP-A0874]
MAGLDGTEDPRRRTGGAGARRPASPGEQQPRDVIERFGNPAAGEVCLPSHPESAAAARRLAHSVVVLQWGLGPVLAEQTVLLVSELVGNAVRHTGARGFGLRMSRRRTRIRVEVRDPSRALPCLMPVRELDTSGRGLFLVNEISDRWGVDLLPRGKTTWFEMRTTEG